MLPDPLPIPAAGTVRGSIVLPGSKSYTNRALPIAALADGTSLLRGALESDDTRYMVEALRALGVAVRADWEAGEIEVEGTGGRIAVDSADLFLGNSGTSMRFLTALAALARGRIRLDGVGRMRQRPLAPLIDGLASLGVAIRSASGCPPVEINADGLPGGTVTMRGDLSSQYFSALAMVLPYADGPLDVAVEGNLVSKPYIDMTTGTMASFGVELHHDGYRRLWVEPGQRYVARTYDIEPDASAASYFYALAAVSGGSITVEHLPPTSAQGDLRFVDVLEAMGCRVERGADAVTVHGPKQLRGIDVDMNAISDTVQTLAAIAPFADAPTTIRNVGHIRLKETDRIAAVAAELRRAGIRVDEREDGLTIYPGTPLPTTIQTYDDHRMAMSFAVMATRVPGTSIADPGCVAKTVPGYWGLLLPLLGAAAP
ncbi:MAG TPA: 3-phosphoshikimate 1-carboxyvinyltransferase [Thermomicrobiales bacterium]|nr:3-phosphoshikimate 1-carboxyvinyltransferase [Thermomicrobiales bacterium]